MGSKQYYSAPETDAGQYEETYEQIAESQIKMAPKLLEAQKDLAPQQQALDLDLLAKSLFEPGGLLDTMGGAGAGEASREGGLADWARQQSAQDVDASVGAEMGAIEKYGGRVSDAMAQANPLLGALTKDASAALARGGEMSAREIEHTISPIMDRRAAMGRDIGDHGTLAAVTRGTRAEHDRRQDRSRAYASNVAGMQPDIIMSMLGRPSRAPATAAGQQAAGSSYNPGQMLNVEGGMNYLLGQQANEMAYRGALAKANAGRSAGIWGALGSVGAAALPLLCWVAREVYGQDNPKWLQFREWMIFKSPSWLLRLYLKHGEWFAGIIHGRPLAKKIIRWWMDTKIKR